jgi:serine protease Do
MMRWQGKAAVILAVVGMAQGRPYFNDQKAPESLADLLRIQSALQENLAQARAATVCLQMDGGGSGSGVIVSEDGLVLTAAHVTGGVDHDITVVMEDGKEYRGVSLGLQSMTDAGMLKIIDEGPFPFVELDEEDSFRLGDWVFSLGHSGGFDKKRGVNVRLGRLTMQADSTIQSGCMLIGGDSGGPLFDMAGRLIGIHSRVGASREESKHVPIREFQRHWDKMLNWNFLDSGSFASRGEAGSGFLGISSRHTGDDNDLRIDEIYEESPAALAGLKPGDLLLGLEVKGREILLVREDLQKENKFLEVLESLSSGETIRLRWARDGESLMKKITLIERP